jgi:hypothetical protein
MLKKIFASKRNEVGRHRCLHHDPHKVKMQTKMRQGFWKTPEEKQ